MTLPRTVKIFEGRRGQPGTDGANGLGSANIHQGLINNPLSYLLKNKDEASVVVDGLSVTRNTEATFTDRYGLVKSPASLTNTNLFTYSTDLTQWTLTDLTLESSTESDPFGGNTATRFSCDTSAAKGLQLTTTLSSEKYYAISFYIKNTVGTIDDVNVFGNFGFTRKVESSIDSNFQRIESYFLGANVTEVGVQITADAGTEFTITGLMIQEGSRITDLISTDGSQETVVSTGSILRNNSSGFIFEGAGENLLINTEDFLTGWSVTGGTLSEYEGVDPFGQKFKKTNIQSLSSETTDFTNIAAASYNTGQTYTFSLYGLIVAGSVSAILVSLAGSDFVPLDMLPTTGFERRSVSLVAGDQNNELVVRITSAVSNANVVITGLQVELGDRLTSYIRSGSAPTPRDADLLTVSSNNNVTAPSDDFSFLLDLSGYDTSGDSLYLFDNAESGVNNFSCWISNGFINLRNEVEVIQFAWANTNTKFALTNSGGTFSVYGDGSLISSDTFISTLVNLSSNMNYLSDINGDNGFFGSVSSLQWFVDARNADEIKYLHGSSV